MKEKEYTHASRILLILRAIVEQPFHYTKKRLAQRYDVSDDTIKRDFTCLQNAGFELGYDGKYRYGLKADKPYEHLKELLVFSEHEIDYLESLLEKDKQNTRAKERLQRKFINIYEMSRLGNSLITKLFLSKVNWLKQAEEEKRCVKLIRYHSTNSSTLKDRVVEPFHVAVEEDILHAYDLERNEIRHFRISRISQVQLLEEKWNFEGKHSIYATDPFRIVSNAQVNVHLRLKVGGYNELVERYPLAKSYLYPAADRQDMFEFIGKVNDKFYGLSNFILGYHFYVEEIIEPDSLILHINNQAQKINF